MTRLGPTVEDVYRARQRARGAVHRTPLVPSFLLSRVLGASVRIKLECVQDTRSFKIRGAHNAIMALREERGGLDGVVTYSTGNHGRATAYVASGLGIAATVCMSHNTSAEKRAALAAMGADLRLVGDSQDIAHNVAVELAEAGLALVDPINDPATTAGHGTIGLELTEDWPSLDTVVVPVSGGALISGIALVVKAALPHVRVVGVSMDRGAAMSASLAAGRPVAVPEVTSLADSLQGGITEENTHTFDMVSELVDELVLVTEEEIGMAMCEAFVHERFVLEGAGATPIAAVLFRDRDLFGDQIALIASGGMVETHRLCEVTARHARALADRLGEAAA